MPPRQEDIARWEAEYNQLMSGQRDEDFDYGSTMQAAWENGLGQYDDYDGQAKFDPDGIPLLGDYDFGASSGEMF